MNQTDLERFIKCYASVGIELTVTENEKGKYVVLGDLLSMTTSEYKVTLSAKFDGHCGFFSVIEFSHSGEFIKQGFWE